LVACAIVAVVLLVPPAVAAAQSVSPCEERFAEQEWIATGDSGGIAAYRAALEPAVAERFADTAREVAALLQADLGAMPAATLCVFGPDARLDATGLLPEGQRLHAAAFAPEALLVIDAQQFRLVDEAIAFGLSHIALWHQAAEVGAIGYPEPLASAVKQWYAARLSGKLEQHHSQMRVGLFFSDPEGKAPPTDWFVANQDSTIVWNPEYQESPIGAFVADAVGRHGTGLLQAPDPDEWAAAEATWRSVLRDELLQGADRSQEWIGGALLAAGVVIGAAGLALWGRRQNRRKQVPMGEIANVEGFFDH
jgi:hypothetical protein